MEQNQHIIPQLIEQEMKQAYVDYAMSVIVGRALPDVRDGLKPVHRRILYAMHESGLLHNKPFKKSAHIVGKVLAETHPHGDMAVYDALVRMAQDFSLRLPLINGQGNWGSIDGDNAAAYRYTEARLNKAAEEMLADIEKGTVDFKPNFDDSSKEPVVLPTRIPNLLINGSTGIAVGMTTNIPTHNLSEVCDAVNLLVDNPYADIDTIMSVLPGPDFPTGAVISGKSGIEKAYKTGRGKITLKSVAEIEENRIIISEIPYMVNKASMIEEIAEQVKAKKIDGIKNIRDESNKEGIRIVVELKSGADGSVVLNKMYKYSRLKTTFGIIFLALVDNQPKLLTLKDMLQQFIAHRKEVVERRTQFELKKAEERVHVLEGIIVALDNLDEVVDGIRRSETAESSKSFLMHKYRLTEIQAKAVLEMRLQKLANMEQLQIREENKELLRNIDEFRSILSSPQKVMGIIKKETLSLKEEFRDERRTVIEDGEDEHIEPEELIEDKPVVVTASHSGYIKRVPLDGYRKQNRGGRGMAAAGTKEEDWIENLFVASTHDYILFFTDKGQVHWLKVYEVPEGGRYAKGRPIVNVLTLDSKEKISAFVPVAKFEYGKYVLMVTKRGTVKKTDLQSFSRPRKGGIRAVNLAEGDELIGVQMTNGKNQIIIATKNGRAVRFDENGIRCMGRSAAGIRGIRLRKDDFVVGTEVVDESKTLLTITNKGYGKRTKIEDYRLVSRGGKGVTNINLTDKNGHVIGVCAVADEDELMVLSKNGIAIRISVKDISIIGRATQGVRVMRLDDGDEAVAVERIAEEESGNGSPEV